MASREVSQPGGCLSLGGGPWLSDRWERWWQVAAYLPAEKGKIQKTGSVALLEPGASAKGCCQTDQGFTVGGGREGERKAVKKRDTEATNMRLCKLRLHFITTAKAKLLNPAVPCNLALHKATSRLG